MNKTVILTIAVLTGLLVLGLNFEEVFSAEPAPSGPVPMPYPVTTKAIPSWVDNNFRWYVDGQIDEKTLLTSMNWMFDNNVMHLSEKAAQEVADLREENKKLRTLVEDEAEYRSGFFKPSEIKESSQKKSEATEFDVAFIPLKDKSTNTEVIILLPTPTDSADLNDAYFLAAMAAVAGTNPSALESRWGEYIADMQTGGVPMDINALIQAVLREAYLETNKDLQFYADKVRYYNDVKEGIRSELTTARQYQSSLSEYAPTGDVQVKTIEPTLKQPLALDYASKQYILLENEGDAMMKTHSAMYMSLQDVEKEISEFALEIAENNKAQSGLREIITNLRDLAADRYTDWPVKITYYDERGNVVSVVVNSAKEAIALAEKLEAQLASMSDTSQTMILDLQQKQQEMSQLMNTFSSILKSWHDTQKSILNNLK